MKNLIKKLRNKGILKIVVSCLFEMLLVYVILSSDEVSEIGRIVCLILWTIACLVYFISGMINLKNYKKCINKYIKIPNYEELNNECKNAKKFSSIYIGEKFVFVISSYGFYVLNLNDIETMHYLHLGENPLKARPGYYYLYLKGEKIKDTIKIYFISKQKLREAIKYLKSKNSDIVIK